MPSGAEAGPLLALAIGLLVAGLVTVGLSRRTGVRLRDRARLPRRGSPTAGAPRAAVIANPIKIANRDARRRWLLGASTAHGWAPPLWLETTIEDPGRGQARAALDAGVDVVIAH